MRSTIPASPHRAQARRVHAAGRDGGHACPSPGTNLDVGPWPDVTCRSCLAMIHDAQRQWAPVPVDYGHPFELDNYPPGGIYPIDVAVPEDVIDAYWSSLRAAKLRYCRGYVARYGS